MTNRTRCTRFASVRWRTPRTTCTRTWTCSRWLRRRTPRRQPFTTRPSRRPRCSNIRTRDLPASIRARTASDRSITCNRRTSANLPTRAAMATTAQWVAT
uniref:(northern house mosquito) hypothetical protein n=1 Tax=Culex pipiens TaxID=7175 RepID=A0A8D8G990_CULPI